MISTMGAHTSEVGRKARPMGMVCAQGPNVKGSTAAVGTMDLKCLVSTHGPVGIPLRASGRMDDGMASAWRVKGDGCTKANGPKDIKGNMELYRVLLVERDTKERGAADCKMDMARKQMQMEVSNKDKVPPTYIKLFAEFCFQLEWDLSRQVSLIG